MNFNRVDETDLKVWAHVYKAHLNSHGVRQRIIARDDYGTITVYPDGSSTEEGPRDANRYSVQHIFSAEESHWVSLFRDGPVWKLFDPSLPGDLYPLPPVHVDFIKRRFPNAVEFRCLSPVQREEPDTWCQTWSLAMFDANWQAGLIDLCNRRKNDFQRRNFISRVVNDYAHKIRPYIKRKNVRLYERVIQITDLRRSFYRFYSDAVPNTVTPYVSTARARPPGFSYPTPADLSTRF